MIDNPYTIISAFPGTGKTYFCNSNNSALDSDSSNFSWIIESGERKRNPDFPNNYIQHIKNNMHNYKYVFVSSHKDVRDALTKHQLTFYLIYPNGHCKPEYLKRYIQRESPVSFIELLNIKWNEWVQDCQQYQSLYCKKFIFDNDDTIAKRIDDIVNCSSHSCER